MKLRSGDLKGEEGLLEGVIILLLESVFLSGCWSTSSAISETVISRICTFYSVYFLFFFLEVEAPILFFL